MDRWGRESRPINSLPNWINESEVKEFIQGLSDSDVNQRRDSVRLLYLSIVNSSVDEGGGLIFNKMVIGLAVEPLIEALEDEDFQVRTFAAMALIYSKSYGALKPFLEISKLEQIDNLDSKQTENFKNLAVLGLGRITSKDSIEPLVELLQEESTSIELKKSAIISLTRLIVEFHWDNGEWAPFTFIFGEIFEKYEGSEEEEKVLSNVALQAAMILDKELRNAGDIYVDELGELEKVHFSNYNLDSSLFRLFDFRARGGK